MLSLPPDILRVIATLESMSTKDILRFCRTNRSVQEAVCNNRQFWNNLLRNRFNIEVIEGPIDEIKRELVIRERALDELTDDISVIRSRGLQELQEDLRYVQKGGLRIWHQNYRSASKSIGRNFEKLNSWQNTVRFVFKGYTKAIVNSLQGPNVLQDDFKRVLYESTLVKDLLEELLQDDRIDGYILEHLLARARQYSDRRDMTDIINMIQSHPKYQTRV